MKGTAYGVGVGPGDPELMTFKAAKIIKDAKVIAVPGKDPKEAVSYKIAEKMVPEIKDKELIAIDMPMVKDRELIRKAHEDGADLIKKYLDRGDDVIYITLGDSTIYCTFSYLQHILERDGYRTELIPGIPSFCAAAARLNTSLTEWDEPLHVIPAVHKTGEKLSDKGNYILMKAASHMKETKEMIKKSGKTAKAVIDCGMDSEAVYDSLEEIPDDAGYFALVIAKDNESF